jgi:hypothetical protein
MQQRREDASLHKAGKVAFFVANPQPWTSTEQPAHRCRDQGAGPAMSLLQQNLRDAG